VFTYEGIKKRGPKQLLVEDEIRGKKGSHTRWINQDLMVLAQLTPIFCYRHTTLEALILSRTCNYNIKYIINNGGREHLNEELQMKKGLLVGGRLKVN